MASIQSLHDQQRRTRNARRRYRGGYVDEAFLAAALRELACQYADCADWVVSSHATQTRYYRLARQAQDEARAL